MSKLIRLADVVDDKIRKEKELEFYEKELQKLHHKMEVLRQEINVTNIIIKLDDLGAGFEIAEGY